MNHLVSRVFVLFIVAISLTPRPAAAHVRNSHDISAQDKKRLERFEKQVDEFRTRLKVPGMSAAIIKDHKVLWAKGFGFADLERRIPATPVLFSTSHQSPEHLRQP